MIEIIKQGKIRHEKTCDNCDCIFKFDAEDVTERVVYDDHGAHYPVTSFLEINCPCCSQKLFLEYADFNKLDISKMKHIDD